MFAAILNRSYWAWLAIVLASLCHFRALAERRVYIPTSVVTPEAVADFYAPRLSHYQFRLSDDPKDQYQLVVIENSDDETSYNGEVALALAQRAKDSTWDEFRTEMATRYPGQFGPERIAKMYAEDRVFGNHMARIVVLEKGPLATARILAAMKLTAEGDNGEGLDIEDALNWLYPRNWRFEVPTYEDPETHRLQALRPRVVGGVTQISGFINRGPRDLGAVIHFAAAHLALQGFAGHPEIHVPAALEEDVRRLTQGRFEPSSTEFLHPSEVVVHCAEAQAKYYQDYMKFRLLHRVGNDFILGMPLANFKHIAEHNVLWRRGRQKVEQYGFESIDDDENGVATSMHWDADAHGFLAQWPHAPVSEFLSMRAPELDAVVNAHRSQFECPQRLQGISEKPPANIVPGNSRGSP